VNKFLKKYPIWSYEKLTRENLAEVITMNDKWFDDRDVANNPGYQDEKQAIMSAFEHMEDLDFTGGLLRVDGEVVAFTLGERINSDTLMIHIEKADTRYDGSYAMINQQYLQNQEEIFSFVNREQDLGIEGLRKAKLSYQPVELLKKYIVIL
jgi:hypothetical protein